MYTGTMIDELIEAVARAEEHTPRTPAYIEPIVIDGSITWGFIFEPACLDQKAIGVA